MGKNFSSNLFDLSSSSSKKKNLPSKSAKSVDFSSASNEETFKTLRKMKEDHQKFVKQIEERFQKAGIDPGQLAKYCQNPDNFSPTKWARLQQSLERLEISITGLSKEDLKTDKKIKDSAQNSKQRRGKTLGARKNWLNMH